MAYYYYFFLAGEITKPRTMSGPEYLEYKAMTLHTPNRVCMPPPMIIYYLYLHFNANMKSFLNFTNNLLTFFLKSAK
jgi:hypothetical protein